MEKERAIQCVPVELIERIRELSAKLWDGRNPASVHLAAILEEFEPEVKSLGNMIKEYESDYAARSQAAKGRYEEKESRLKQEIEDLKARLAKSEASRAEALKRLEESRRVLSERDSILADLKIKSVEEEGELNSKYVTRMQELYEKVSRKELEILQRWEDKNRALEVSTQEFESSRAARERQLKTREKALEEEFNARKAELIRTFDRIREGLEAREKALAAREADKPAKAGGI
jgi:DNA repair exonuclease SbcCD ATPase subunit